MVLNKRKTVETGRTMITTYSHPDSFISEQFRMIETNIKFILSNQKSQTFLITSPGDGEGKSTIVTNLAASMAQQKKKVLLIDANLRKPVLHSFFNISNTDGLADVLTGRLSLSEAVHHTEIWRLDFLSSGQLSINPVELLGSQIMKDLLKKTMQMYDLIFIDSPGILDIPDSKLLANESDGVIMVIKDGKTKSKDAIEAKKFLEFAKANIIGVVVNQ